VEWFVRRVLVALCIIVSACGSLTVSANELSATNGPSGTPSADDGWPDASAFLEKKYGFLPIIIPITEPAVGYGAAGGLLFLSKPLSSAEAGLGRPDMTMVGGLGTENGTWATAVGDVRHWFDDRVQTVAGLVYASANLDFYGVGKDLGLEAHPLHYNLRPAGGMLQGKYRIGNSRVWAGMSYAFAATQVEFSAPEGTAGIPDFQRHSNVGGVTPSFTYDTRDNIFTPLSGTYVEATVGLFSEALGGDDEFQRARVILMQYIPLFPRIYLGVRVEGAASFGNEPFYLRPYISLRGAPVMRYQGEEVAQLEAELRWQFWKRLSLVGFVGGGAAWNHFERFDSTQTIVTGGTGVRYELARAYGIHVGVDLAFAPDNTAVYIQVGSAWARP